MILILLGTQDKPFDRILKEVSKLKKEGYIKDKVVAQTGYTKFDDENIECFDFVSKKEVEELIEKARIVIAHGGVGIITECLSMNKKVIVVPRLKKYKEHTNDHQLQIVKEFAKQNYILPLYKTGDLKEVLEKLKKFKPAKYEAESNNFVTALKKYIEEL